MKNKNLTPWYPPHIKPVRVGVYRADWSADTDDNWFWYAYWDGSQWGWMDYSPEEAVSAYFVKTEKRHRALAWRGLTKGAAND